MGYGRGMGDVGMPGATRLTLMGVGRVGMRLLD